MSTNEERIPADEYARCYGWRTSAVIHRIRAGIYTGFREGKTWYVVPKVAESDTEVVQDGEHERSHSRSSLPWRTVSGPFHWVSWVVWIFVAVLAIVIYVEETESLFFVVGLGMFAFSSAALYEAFRTGTIRNGAFPVAFSEHPIMFFALAATYAMLAVMGVVVLVAELIEWLSAA